MIITDRVNRLKWILEVERGAGCRARLALQSRSGKHMLWKLPHDLHPQAVFINEKESQAVSFRSLASDKIRSRLPFLFPGEWAGPALLFSSRSAPQGSRHLRSLNLAYSHRRLRTPAADFQVSFRPRCPPL